MSADLEASLCGNNDGSQERNPFYHMLQSDVEPFYHVIPSFLSTGDRLRLSECCKGLLRYRYLLSRVKIVPHISPLVLEMRRAISRLLSEQQGGLRYLQIGDLTDEETAWLRAGELKTGSLHSLEVLNISNSRIALKGLRDILESIVQGACPNLRHLNLSRCCWNHWKDGAGIAVAHALMSGNCRMLQELNLSSNHLAMGGFAPIADALGKGACPDLRCLNLSICSLSPDDGQLLSAILETGALARLESLDLSRNYRMGDTGLIPIWKSIGCGSCPSIKQLGLVAIGLTTASCMSLALALSQEGCHQLQWLDLYRTMTDGSGSLHILEALKQGACPDLRYLNLGVICGGGKLYPDHGRVLAAALAKGSFAMLEELVLSGNESLGDDGMLPVIKALEVGALPHMKRLELSAVGMGSIGATALAEAVECGSLAELQELSLNRNQAIGDDAMVKLLLALSSGNCQDLRLLSAWNAGMGEEAGHALVDALKRDAWPRLHTLSVRTASLGGEWLCCLASVLKDRAGLSLERIRLSCVVTAEGFHELSRAFRQGACPMLKYFSVMAVVAEHVDDFYLEELKKSLEGRAGVSLEQVEYSTGNMDNPPHVTSDGHGEASISRNKCLVSTAKRMSGIVGQLKKSFRNSFWTLGFNWEE